MKYYLDSSENGSDEPSHAIAWYDTEDEARTAAQTAAIKAPGTIFFVQEVVETYRCIYKAAAKVELATEVLNGSADPN